MAFLLVVVLLVLCIAIATTRRKTKQPSSAFPLSNLPDAIQAKIVQSHLDTKSRVAFAIAKKDGFDNPQDLKKALYTQDPKRVQCLELLCLLRGADVGHRLRREPHCQNDRRAEWRRVQQEQGCA